MKILLIDDSKFSRMSMIKLLREVVPDAEITEAVGSDEGIMVYDNETPELVLTDLVMPGKNGDEVVKHIRNTNKTCFVCVLSANIQRIVQEEMLEIGADLFLEKPITLTKIDTLLDAFHQKKSYSDLN